MDITKPTASEQISRLEFPDENASLPRPIQRLFRNLHIAKGFIPNYFRAHALNADSLDRFNGYMGPLLGETHGLLPIREKELICLVASAANQCNYCEVFHIDSLGKVLRDKAKASRICLNYKGEDLSERERALADLAVMITRDPHAITPQMFEELRQLGLNDNEILEAIEIAALMNATNRIIIALDVPPDMEFFGTSDT